jgi:hypothetical protein
MTTDAKSDESHRLGDRNDSCCAANCRSSRSTGCHCGGADGPCGNQRRQSRRGYRRTGDRRRRPYGRTSGGEPAARRAAAVDQELRARRRRRSGRRRDIEYNGYQRADRSFGGRHDLPTCQSGRHFPSRLAHANGCRRNDTASVGGATPACACAHRSPADGDRRRTGTDACKHRSVSRIDAGMDQGLSDGFANPHRAASRTTADLYVLRAKRRASRSAVTSPIAPRLRVFHAVAAADW